MGYVPSTACPEQALTPGATAITNTPCPFQHAPKVAPIELPFTHTLCVLVRITNSAHFSTTTLLSWDEG
jgi:hypothetical protein